MVHFYEIIHKGDFGVVEKQIMDEAKKSKKKIKIIYKAKVRDFSPTKEQVVFDILVQ